VAGLAVQDVAALRVTAPTALLWLGLATERVSRVRSLPLLGQIAVAVRPEGRKISRNRLRARWHGNLLSRSRSSR